MDTAINEDDFRKVFGNKCRVIPYEKVSSLGNLNNYFKRKKCVFILYNYAGNYGHWTCLFKSPEGGIEFFDSYGTKPDYELKDFPDDVRIEHGMRCPLLVKKLIQSKQRVHFNNHKLQKSGKGVQTCGRWCIMRVLKSNEPIDKFAASYKGKKKSPDQLVVDQTVPLLGK